MLEGTMNSLEIIEPGLLASKDALKNLKEKSIAHILVISDSHGSQEIINIILKKFASGCDALCFCGDGMGDLLSCVEADMASARSSQLPPVIAFVQGNGDMRDFYIQKGPKTLCVEVPKTLSLNAAGTKVFMTHGHRYDVYYKVETLQEAAKNEGTQIAFFGHTHIANVIDGADGMPSLLNPGSCARPRGGQPHTFAVVEVVAGDDKLHYHFYQMRENGAGEIIFQEYAPLKGAVNLFW